MSDCRYWSNCANCASSLSCKDTVRGSAVSASVARTPMMGDGGEEEAGSSGCSGDGMVGGWGGAICGEKGDGWTGMRLLGAASCKDQSIRIEFGVWEEDVVQKKVLKPFPVSSRQLLSNILRVFLSGVSSLVQSGIHQVHHSQFRYSLYLYHFFKYKEPMVVEFKL